MRFPSLLAWRVGTFLGMGIYPAMPRIAFVLSGVIPELGFVVILAWRPTFTATAPEHRRRAPFSILRNFLSFGSTWSQGFLEGGMIGLLPLYLLSVGLSDTGASYLMGGLMVGVIIAQLPLAWLADRFGRFNILAACNVITLVGLAGLMVHAVGGIAWLALSLFVVGACSGAFYPLGLALLGDRIPRSALASANGHYLAINSLGSLVGPAIAGAAMDHFGRVALFTSSAVAVGVMFAVGLALEIGVNLSKAKMAVGSAATNEEPAQVPA